MSSQKNTGKNTEAPGTEQEICIRCGFCCDGTIFLYACLNPGERGNLPEKIEENSYSQEGKDYFRLPCSYFKDNCMIYGEKRADVCGSYRCQLLRDLAEHRITSAEAALTVKNAFDMRAEIMKEYRALSRKNNNLSFRQLLLELGTMQKTTSGDVLPAPVEMLLTRCNIFGALLIRHFRSNSDFDRMTVL